MKLFLCGGGADCQTVEARKRLNEIKMSKAFEKIMEYLTLDSIVFGGSAGVIIFGKDLEACRLDDVNKVELTETQGFDVLNGISILCHYTNRNVEKHKETTEYLLTMSKHKKIIALPEETTLFINGNIIEIIGSKPYYYFENGRRMKKEI